MEKNEANKLTIPASLEEIICVLDAEGHCITCSDEAWPVRVLHIDQQTGLALVHRREEQQEEVDITLVADVMPGDWLLVHGGVALERLARPGSDEGSNAGY